MTNQQHPINEDPDFSEADSLSAEFGPGALFQKDLRGVDLRDSGYRDCKPFVQSDLREANLTLLQFCRVSERGRRKQLKTSVQVAQWLPASHAG